MYFTSAQIQSLDEPNLRRFVEQRKPEGHQLDYKTALSGSNDRAKREFLKDVTAFANANGGNILIGVDEPQNSISVDHQIRGIDGGEPIAQDLERLASSSIDPRVSGLLLASERKSDLTSGFVSVVSPAAPECRRSFPAVTLANRFPSDAEITIWSRLPRSA